MKSLIKNKIQGKNGLGWVTMAQGLVFGVSENMKRALERRGGGGGGGRGRRRESTCEDAEWGKGRMC